MGVDVSPGFPPLPPTAPPPSAPPPTVVVPPPPPPPPTALAPPSAPPPPIYPQYGYVPGGPSPVVRTSGHAVAALIFALLSIVVPFVLVPAAIVVAVRALRRIARTPFLRGKGMAISALVITALSVLGWLAVVAASDEPTGTGPAGRPPAEHLVATVAPACRGVAVPEAGAFRGDGPFHLVVAKNNGQPMAWSARNARWRADEVADAELVACIAQQSNLIETCPYYGPDINRYETVMTVRVVTARRGGLVTSFQLTAQPRACRSTELMSTVRLDGTIPFAQLSQRLGMISVVPAGAA